MPTYIIDTSFGLTVEEHKDKRTAEREGRKAHGTNNFNSVKLATLEDLRWVKAMGGWIPCKDRLRIEAVEENYNER